MADRPHFAYPFERGADGKVAVVEQDDDVLSNRAAQGKAAVYGIA
jgi:hypothetical protein